MQEYESTTPRQIKALLKTPTSRNQDNNGKISAKRPPIKIKKDEEMDIMKSSVELS